MHIARVLSRPYSPKAAPREDAGFALGRFESLKALSLSMGYNMGARWAPVAGDGRSGAFLRRLQNF